LHYCKEAVCSGSLSDAAVRNSANQDHTIIRGDARYKETMCIQLDAHKRSMKDHLFTTGRRNIKVVDPKLNTRGMSSEEI
jgi:hypothetical protein